MFGYVVCKKSELSEEEQQRYQEVYCGLCQSLCEQYGPSARYCLNYDMVFLLFLLSSLYERVETRSEFRCSVHPVRKKQQIRNACTEYGAAMTIALTYHKCLDDWRDENKKASKNYAGKIRSAYESVQKAYPRQCQCIADCMTRLHRIEHDMSVVPDQAANCFGRLLSEVFVWQEDIWQDSLRRIGYEMGRFIYLMDAAMDYKKDRKKGNYNPLFLMNMSPQEAEPILNIMIGSAVEEMERLPLLQDEAILKNIVYSGVWQQYYARYHRKENDK